MKNENPVALFSAAEISKIAEDSAVYKTFKHPLQTFGSAIMAGAFISIAFAFYITVTTGGGSAPFGLVKLVGGICFSLGLILVVVCGNDLFTSTVLTSIAKASRRITWTQMFNNWLNVYFSNFIGALILVAIIWFAGEHMAANGQWGLNVLNTTQHKLEHTFVEAFFLGIMANVMVCLAVWMSYAGRTLTDKTLIMILPVAMFVASGFEHSIANMFMIPLGITIKNAAAPEFWQLISASPEQFAHLTIGNFIIDNLIPVTLGNIAGGLMVGLPNWVMHLRNDKH